MILLSQNSSTSKVRSEISYDRKRAPVGVSHLASNRGNNHRMQNCQLKIAVTLGFERVTEEILKTTSGVMDVIMTGWFFCIIRYKVSLCVFVHVIQTKRNQGVSEELISTLLLSAERSDEYSYYVNDCSCVCTANPDFAFCVAASFAQRSKCEWGLCGCKRLVAAPLSGVNYTDL